MRPDRTTVSLSDLRDAGRFVVGLQRFLRRPLVTAEARTVLRQRLPRREADFLNLVQRVIYGRSTSPYARLLQIAGCELGDLEQLVRAEGLEQALQTLLARGVYLTVDELKGRRQVIRGSTTVRLSPDQLRNPLTSAIVPAGTGSSRGVGVAVPMDFPHLRDRAVNTLLAFEARGGSEWVKAHWHVPGGGVLARLLEFSCFGAPVERWFSQVDPGAPGLHPRYRWSARALRWGSLLAGVPLPRPEYVPLDDPLPIARWMASLLSRGQTPHLFTFASSAVRLCQAAEAKGLDLAGAQFTVTGEPLTRARRSAIERAGAAVVPRFAATECGVIGFGCLAPSRPDDIHQVHDLHALIQPTTDDCPTTLSRHSLLLTSLRATAPFILLNASLGDQAETVKRRCGCPLEELGWTTHLHSIRSQEKLTAAGMTFLDADVVRVLEESLPTRFGGGPTDYQLVEAEAEDGRPVLRLLVHPSVGPLDGSAVAACFLQAIGAGGDPERVMATLWSEAGLPRVERLSPYTTPIGKILHIVSYPQSEPSSAQSSQR